MIVFIKLLVSVVLLGLLLWRTPLSDVLAHLYDLHAVTLLACAGLAMSSWVLSAIRLWCLLPTMSLPTILRNTFTSLFYATVLPGQIAGDIVKAYRLGKSAQQRGHAEAATFVDRGIALFALFCMSAAVAPMSARIPQLLSIFFVAGAIAMAIGALVLASNTFRRMVEPHRQGESGGARRFLRHFAIALHDCLRKPYRMLAAFALALVFHALCVLTQMILAADLRISLEWFEWVALYSGVSLVTLVPFSIAGIGLREGSFVSFLSLFGVASSAALSQSLATFALALLGTACGGLIEAYDAVLQRKETNGNAADHSSRP